MQMCSVREKQVSGLNCGPHTFGLALDLGISVEEQVKFMELINEKCPQFRVGTNVKPGQVHIHIDNCYIVLPRPLDVFVKGARWIE